MDYGVIRTAHPRIIIQADGASPPSTGTEVHWHVDAPDDLLFLGEAAGNIGTSSGLRSIGIGKDVLGAHTSGSDIVGVGSGALVALLGGSNVVAVGSSAGAGVTTGSNHVLIGRNVAASLTTGVRDVVIGDSMDVPAAGTNDLIAIGSQAAGNAGQLVVVDPSINGVFVGDGTPGNWPTATGRFNVAVGRAAGGATTSANNYVALGNQAAESNTDNDNFVAVGAFAAQAWNPIASVNAFVAVGDSAGIGTSNLESAVLVGQLACWNVDDVEDTVAIGTTIGPNSGGTGTATQSILMGTDTGALATNIVDSVLIGYHVADAATGALSRCVIIGADMEASSAAESDLIAIGSQSAGNAGQLMVVDPALNGVFMGAGTPGNWPTLTGLDNTVIGDGAAIALTSGLRNVFIGKDVAAAMQAGSGNVAIGDDAAKALMGGSTVAIGASAASEETTSGGTYVGAFAGRFVVGGTNVAVGFIALQGAGTGQTSIGRNTAIGYQTLNAVITNATANTAVGYLAGSAVSTGDDNVLLGDTAGDTLTTGSRNIIIGKGMDTPASGTNDLIAIGALGGTGQLVVVDPGIDGVFIGASTPGNWPTVTGIRNTIIGDTAGAALTTAERSTFIGAFAGDACTDGAKNTGVGAFAMSGVIGGDQNTSLGFNAALGLTTGSDNLALGAGAAAGMTTGSRNVIVGAAMSTANIAHSDVIAIGSFAGGNAGQLVVVDHNINGVFIGAATPGNWPTVTGLDNIAIGDGSGAALTTAAQHVLIGTGTGEEITVVDDPNVYVGYHAGRFLGGTGEGISNRNVAVGPEALEGAATGQTAVANNVAVGYRALRTVNSVAGENAVVGANAGEFVTTGSGNVFLGWQAGIATTTGSRNILIGYQIDASAVGVDDELNIGDLIFGDLAGIGVRIGGSGAVTNTGLLLEAGNLDMDSNDIVNVRIDSGIAVTVTDPAGATPAINWTTNKRQQIVLSANATLGAFVDPAGPTTGLRLSIKQHATTGPYTFDWNSRVKWAAGVEPVVTFVDAAECLFYFDFDGTDYIGTGILDIS